MTWINLREEIEDIFACMRDCDPRKFFYSLEGYSVRTRGSSQGMLDRVRRWKNANKEKVKEQAKAAYHTKTGSHNYRSNMEAKRILALGLVSGGMSARQAAIKAGVNRASVARWMDEETQQHNDRRDSMVFCVPSLEMC